MCLTKETQSGTLQAAYVHNCSETSLSHQDSHAIYTAPKSRRLLIVTHTYAAHSLTHTSTHRDAIVCEGIQASGEQKPSTVTLGLSWLRAAGRYESLREAFR